MCCNHQLKYTPSVTKNAKNDSGSVSENCCPEGATDAQENDLRIVGESVAPTLKSKRGNNRKPKTLEKCLEDFRKRHGDVFDYSSVKYVNAVTKVIVTCRVHGEFEINPNAHRLGVGCAKCSAEKLSNKNTIVDSFVQIHGNRYDYSGVDHKNNRTKVKIICREHGAFYKLPHQHLLGVGCEKCSDFNNGRISSTTKCINKFTKIHGSKYDYSLVDYRGGETKVKIICREHGVFEQTPREHSRDHGCPKCGLIHEGGRITQEMFLAKVRENFGDKYEYPDLSFKNLTDKIRIICPTHGEFKTTAYNHYRGRQCWKCFLDDKTKRRTYTNEQFIEKSREVHGDYYDYSKVVYIHSRRKVIIICPDHGEFVQTPEKHIPGGGCPICNPKFFYPALHWLRTVHDLDNTFEYEYRLPEYKRMAVDAYDQKTNTVYQFHGDYYHGNPRKNGRDEYNKKLKKTHGELYDITLMREQMVRDFGYSLIVMWEDTWRKATKIRWFKKECAKLGIIPSIGKPSPLNYDN